MPQSRRGREFADVSAAYGKSLSVDLERNAINLRTRGPPAGYSVRAIYQRRHRLVELR